MERIWGFLVFFAAVWLAFAIWNIGGSSDVVKVYTATETLDRNSSFREGSILPEYFPLNVAEYRISDTVVFRKNGDFVDRFEDCDIFDKKNWSCTYSDGSEAFGFQAGSSFFRSNTDKFPDLANYPEEHHLSRFRYMTLSCRWDWSDGVIQMIACLIRPFST